MLCIAVLEDLKWQTLCLNPAWVNLSCFGRIGETRSWSTYRALLAIDTLLLLVLPNKMKVWKTNGSLPPHHPSPTYLKNRPQPKSFYSFMPSAQLSVEYKAQMFSLAVESVARHENKWTCWNQQAYILTLVNMPGVKWLEAFLSAGTLFSFSELPLFLEHDYHK